MTPDSSPPVSHQSPWMPIGTAPKDGTLVDLWVAGQRRADCFWSDSYDDGPGEWRQRYAEAVSDFPIGGSPTHWMPRPPSPEAAT